MELKARLRDKISGLLFAERAQRRLSMERMAGKCGIGYQAYSKLEKGQSIPSLPNAVRIAKEIDFDLNELKELI